MSTIDLSPLYRSSVGFERLPTLLSDAVQRGEVGYPPYNIEKTGEDTYRIAMAVAGFSADDVEIVAERNRVTIRGNVQEDKDTTYLHRGIAARAFERHFDLAEYVEVAGASLENGLLQINLKREVPERMKPRQIEIGGESARRTSSRKVEKVAA